MIITCFQSWDFNLDKYENNYCGLQLEVGGQVKLLEPLTSNFKLLLRNDPRWGLRQFHHALFKISCDFFQRDQSYHVITFPDLYS